MTPCTFAHGPATEPPDWHTPEQLIVAEARAARVRNSAATLLLMERLLDRFYAGDRDAQPARLSGEPT